MMCAHIPVGPRSICFCLFVKMSVMCRKKKTFVLPLSPENYFFTYMAAIYCFLSALKCVFLSHFFLEPNKRNKKTNTMNGFLVQLLHTALQYPSLSAAGYDQNLKRLWSGLEEFYAKQDAPRAGRAFVGLPLLLTKDLSVTLSEKSVRKDPKVSRKLLHQYGQMADAAYELFWKSDSPADFGKVIHKRDESALHLPAHCVIDVKPTKPGTKAVLVIRGTLQLADVLTDLNAKGTPWPGKSNYGHVHTGLIASAQNVLREAQPALDKYKDITVVGHSLGGGTATYVTLLLQEQGKQATCYSFGSPPTLEKATAIKVRGIYSVINNNDLVPRLSYESALHLQDRAADLVDNVAGMVVKAWGKDYEGTSKRAEEGREKELHCAGHCILKVEEEIEELENDDVRRRPVVIVSPTMLLDHMSANYIIDNVKKAAENEENTAVNKNAGAHVNAEL